LPRYSELSFISPVRQLDALFISLAFHDLLLGISTPTHDNALTNIQDNDTPAMARHPDVPGLEVVVVVDEQSLPEYADEDEKTTPDKTSVYIQSKAGSEFRIKLYFGPTFPYQEDVSIRFHIDGILMRRIVETHEECLKQHVSCGSSSYWENGVNMRQCFKFAETVIGKSTADRAVADND